MAPQNFAKLCKTHKTFGHIAQTVEHQLFLPKTFHHMWLYINNPLTS
ncbi:hypothetical protein QCMSULEJ_CDS0069 [Escherichia phage KS_W4]